VHDADVEFNTLYQLVTPIFEDESTIHEQSGKIAQHLYNQSNHPHIKSGEVYIALLHDTYLDNEKVKAVGIFKSEVKNSFLQFEEQGNQLEMIIQEGVNIHRLDKGCIIFNVNKEDGYKILSIDSNRYDTKYWLENFLNEVSNKTQLLTSKIWNSFNNKTIKKKFCDYVKKNQKNNLFSIQNLGALAEYFGVD